MGKFDGVSDEELIARLRAGETAIEDYLMEKYKGLVRQKARAMFLIGGDTDDLIQEGMIGLFKAVRDFQKDTEASFATFAIVCIDRQIYSAIQNSNRQKHQPLNSYVSLNQEDESSPIWELSVENPESIEALNHLLHEYGKYIIGRMGIPYREREVNIISVAIDAPQDVINALSGKIGRLDGIGAKTAYSNIKGKNQK